MVSKWKHPEFHPNKKYKIGRKGTLIRQIHDGIQDDVSNSIIVNFDGNDELVSLDSLKRNPKHISFGNKVIGEIRYQGSKGKKPIRARDNGDLKFTGYWRKDAMQVVGFKTETETFIKVKGGKHDIMVSIDNTDVFERHKLMFAVSKMMGATITKHKNKRSRDGFDEYRIYPHGTSTIYPRGSYISVPKNR